MYEKRIIEFEQEDAQKFPAPDVNLFVGSSSIRRWYSLKRDMEPKPILRRGFGGSDMKSLLLLYDKLIKPYTFSKLFVYEGDNDLSGRKGYPQKVLDLFIQIEEKAHVQCPNAEIIFISIKCSPTRERYWNKFMAANKLFEEYCSTKPYLNFIDIASAMFDKNGKANKELFNEHDGIHPSQKGYETIAQIIKPYLYPSDIDK